MLTGEGVQNGIFLCRQLFLKTPIVIISVFVNEAIEIMHLEIDLHYTMSAFS